MANVSPARIDEVEEARHDITARPWNVVVWDDPVNLMTYVVWVFRRLFGYSEEKATRLMLDVHHRGRAVVTSEPRERAEVSVTRLHQHGLWATLERG
ncbi:MAG TPA: ATP-dependent Clp protease adapter ClpS [Acidimicrobiia bacterium]|jgi:ATP-dependent Clp protease adaptor protein ClpS